MCSSELVSREISNLADEKIAFVGIGIMGSGMLGNVLKAGYDVTAFDLNQEALDAAVDAGATAATSAAEAAANADLVHTVVPGPPELEAAVFGNNGIAAGIRPGSVFIQHATVDPETVISVADRLKKQGVDTIDAPLLRTPGHAASGNLGFPIGAEPDVYARAKDVLATMSDTIYETGAVGTGSALKLVNNMLNITILCGAMEAITLGTKSGLKLGTMIDAFYTTPARALHFEMMPWVFENRDFSPGFYTTLGHKDIRLAVKHALNMRVPTSVSAAAYAMMAQAEAAGLGRETYSSVLKLYEAAAEVTVELERDKLFEDDNV